MIGGLLVSLVFYPYLLMLGLGALRAEVSQAIPAPSFVGSFILTGMIFLLTLPFAAAVSGAKSAT